MANKRLSLAEIDQLRQMVMQGVAPEDLAHHFKISIASVHNYKSRFKSEGVQFPNLRGMRPSGNVTIPIVAPTGSIHSPTAFQPKAGQPTGISQPLSTASAVGPVSASSTAAGSANTFVVTFNGVPVNIEGAAKSVNVSSKGIDVKY